VIIGWSGASSFANLLSLIATMSSTILAMCISVL
jgi:hypothetical protein